MCAVSVWLGEVKQKACANDNVPVLENLVTNPVLEMQFYARKCVEDCLALKRELDKTNHILGGTKRKLSDFSHNLDQIDDGMARIQMHSRKLVEIVEGAIEQL